MKWRGRRVSKNIQDWTDRKFPKDPMIADANITGPMTVPKQKFPKSIPIPPKRPKTHNNLITPGKWRTK